MFKLIPDSTFKAEVKLTVPGQAKPVPVEVEFRHKGRAALKTWLENTAGKSDADLLDEIIADMPLSDADGHMLAYTRDRLEQLLDRYPASAQELTRDYVLALTESRSKN